MTRNMYINNVEINATLKFGWFLENLDKPKYKSQKVCTKFRVTIFHGRQPGVNLTSINGHKSNS